MKNSLLLVVFLSLAGCALAQDPMIAYAVRGSVTATYKKESSMVKIGRVLLPGTVLTIGKDGAVTLLCKKGRQFLINKEGTVPVWRYKDSCKYTEKNITADYLSYIWGQFYEYSAENRKEKKENLLAVSRSPGNENKRKHDPNRLLIEFNKGMDTVIYSSKDFSLGWNCFDYDGAYVFRLYDENGLRQLFIDTTEDNFVLISKLGNFLKEGSVYKWNVSAPHAAITRKRVLKFLPQSVIDNYIRLVQAELIPNENEASKYFRIAYALEQQHYLADALEYFTMANKADPSIHIFRDKLVQFRNEFWVQN